jgi:hypothetical protein
MAFLSSRVLALAFIAVVACTVARADETCRYAPTFTTNDIATNETVRLSFLETHASMEKYFMLYAGLDPSTQMTRDGHPLSIETGKLFGEPHMFSAPSKESVHVALLCKVLEKTSSVANQTYSIADALNVLEAKVTSFEAFGEAYPGFGGFFPWVAYDGNGTVAPTWDWQNRVPALDNGELFWAAFAVSFVLNETEYRTAKPGLAERWTRVWKNMVRNAVTVFYAGNGNIRTVTNIANQRWPVENNTYTGAPGYLNDPYEGELFTMFVYLFNEDLSSTEKEQLWINKRGMLQSVNLTVPHCGNQSSEHCAVPTITNITVQKGFWFSAHEQWKYLMLPYEDSPTNKRVFLNGERARTWYARMQRAPGLWASVNGPIPNDNASFPYFSDCGVPPIAFQNVTHDDVITPYGMFPLYLASPPHGAAWLHHMILNRKGQNCYGTTESFNVTGTDVAPLVTWDSKITTLAATAGGLAETNKRILRSIGKYEPFVSVIENEWARVFPEPVLSGSNLDFVFPEFDLPQLLEDFTSCSSTSPACVYQ